MAAAAGCGERGAGGAQHRAAGDHRTADAPERDARLLLQAADIIVAGNGPTETRKNILMRLLETSILFMFLIE